MQPRFEGHTGKIVLILLIAISLFMLIPINLVIIYQYCKNKSNLSAKAANFNAGLLYFIVTLLFYLNYCARLLNECYGVIDYGYIFVCTTAFFYGIRNPFFTSSLFHF